MSGRAIGAIDIYNTNSCVEVPADNAREVISIMRAVPIRGQASDGWNPPAAGNGKRDALVDAAAMNAAVNEVADMIAVGERYAGRNGGRSGGYRSGGRSEGGYKSSGHRGA